MVTKVKSSGIGGQAVMEGVMMKNKDQYAVAVRKPNGEIIVEKKEHKSISDRYPFMGLPILRGIVAFAESMSLGMKTLTFSASFFEEEEEEQPDKIEKALTSIFKDKAEAVLMGLTVVIAIVLAIGIFMVLPWFVTECLAKVVTHPIAQAALEGLLRLVIFILYVACISVSKDIKRVYMYHGAEHKTINCVENRLPLTVANVRNQSKEHRRCGTSFMLYVIIISIIFFVFIRVDNPGLRMLLRVLLVPVVAGISYEFIRFTGSMDNAFTKILSRPGMWMQSLTTKEPEDDMIEVAIASVEAVFDWEAYIGEGKGEKKGSKKKRQPAPKVTVEEEDEIADKQESKEKRVSTVAQVAPLKKADASTRRASYFKEVDVTDKKQPQNEKQKEETVVGQESQQKQPSKAVALKKAQKVRRPLQAIEEVRRESNEMLELEEEEDEILSALDKFFQ